MSENAKCPKCGGDMSADAPGELCPNCLMATGLQSHSVEEPASEEQGTTAALPDSASPAPDLAPGQRFGRYRIVRRLGRGGMGAVYEAEDLDNNRRVALKVLGHSFDSPDARRRFLREGRLAASVNHPNSVYVYGTGDVGGTPVISMELVPGGTLERRVRHEGPLPVAEAVDAVLEVIAGLEAAQAAGVLHRDVKAANCFVDPEGRVKVGDFGLSISTAPRGDSVVTIEGAFLGTPAYASPEQLRGDELDLRSDIYSVGVTLYYLLTGRTPFENRNLVQFLATVLEQAAPSPRTLRADIPKDLARVILRCLEKQPASRFGNYADLREALLPYSSTAPTAGTLGLRFAASIVDGLTWSCLYMLVALAWFGDLSPILFADIPGFGKLLTLFLLNSTLYSTYYAVFEGIWGATPGKALCWLRVVDTSGSAPGIPRALGRALFWVIVPQLPVITYSAFAGTDALAAGTSWVSPIIGFLFYIVLAVLFSTARRRNGYAGVHDLLTGVRVISRSSYQTRPVASPTEDALPDTECMPKIGPYYVLNELDQSDDAEFLVGYDVRLLRKVWIRKTSESAPPVPDHVRNQSRVGRVRWLGGKREPGERWDAYECLSGRPLIQMLDRPQPWHLVRYWMADLSEELNAALKDDTVPDVLSLERVWITGGNRAKVLDFPAPFVGEGAGASSVGADDASRFTACRRFLNEVAVAALEGRRPAGGEAEATPAAAPVPLHARTVLDSLPSCPGPRLPAEAFKPMLQMVPQVSRLRRFGLVLGSIALPAVFAVMFCLVGLFYHHWQKTYPELATLRHCLLKLQVLQQQNSLGEAEEQRRRDLQIYIGTQLRETVLDEKAMSNGFARAMILPDQRALAEKAVAEYGDAPQEEIEESTLRLKHILAEARTVTAGIIPKSVPLSLIMAVMVGELLLVGTILPSLFFALVCRGGFLIHTLGIAIVTKRGARASRLRTFWRSLIAWSPILGFPVLLVLSKHYLGDLIPGGLPGNIAFWATGVLCVVTGSSLLPGRSLQDRLARTYLVPK